MTKRPFLVMGAFSFVAALLCTWLSLGNMVLLIVAAALVLFTALLVFRKRFMNALCWGAAGALVVAVVFLLKDVTVMYPQLAHDGHMATVTMRVTQPHSSGMAYVVRVEDGELASGTKLFLWTGNKNIAPKAGDILEAEVLLSAAVTGQGFEEVSYAKANGIYLNAKPLADSLVWKDGSSSLSFPERMLFSLRESIHNTLYRHSTFDNAALCESVLLGSRGNLSEETAWAFRASGVYHLLAVSGLHLSILTAAVLWILTRCGVRRRPRTVIAMAVAVLFMALCGFSASVSRAGVMMLIILVSMLFRRRGDGLNSLGLAAVCMLLFDPYAIYDLGFQLSFAATLAMLTLVPVWEREVTQRAIEKLPKMGLVLRPLLSSIGVALCAALMTQPLTALYFGELSTLFLFGNLLCVFPASLLMIVGLIAVIAAPIPLVSDLLFGIAALLCNWLQGVTAWLASWNVASINIREPFLLVWLFVLTAAVIAGYGLLKMRGVLRAVAVMLCILLVVLPFSKLLLVGTVSVAAASGESAAVAIKTDDSRGLVFSGGDDALADTESLLKGEGITQLEWVLWLEEPSLQNADLSAFSIPITQLILLHEPERYTALPPAQMITVLDSNGTITFSENGVIEKRADFYRFVLGKTVMLLCPPEGDVKELPPEWLTAQVVLLQQAVPQNAALLSADYTVAFCSYYATEGLQAAIPRTLGTLYMAVSETVPVFLTRTNGDISLRAY